MVGVRSAPGSGSTPAPAISLRVAAFDIAARRMPDARGTQNPQQFNYTQYFAYRDGVKPDGVGTRRMNHGRKKSEAFRKSRKVPAIAQSPVK